MKVIILAGGSGTRLWPLSRERYPKQFIKFHNRKLSLFQETFNRSLLLAKADDIYVVTNQNYKFLVMGSIDEMGIEFDEAHILIEPEPKNTLPAIYYGVHEIEKNGADTVVVFASDHVIEDSKELVRMIKASEDLSKEYIVTFGIKPTEPNTGYGYIAPGGPRGIGYNVTSFKEKPDYDTAVEYIKEDYLWNSGMFMFNSAMFKSEVKAHTLDIYNAFEDNENIESIFENIDQKISMDYGIMEKSDHVVVVPLNIAWNDLGSFDAFYDVFPKDEQDNVIDGDNIMINSSRNIVHSDGDKLVATVGVEDLIIVDNKDALLICKKDQSQHVKDIVGLLNEKHDRRTKYHLQDYRPWGFYTILGQEESRFKIKSIVVLQGKKLSYQRHYHRSEHWVVVKGMAKVTIDDVEQFVPAGESVFIKVGQKHRLENPGMTPLEIIEVQMGDYLEEDDIVRFDDAFGRK